MSFTLTTKQLLTVSELPESLWDSNYAPDLTTTPGGCLKLPEKLNQIYVEVLEEMGLLEIAGDVTDRTEGPIGGEEDANDHFAKRFSGSCGKVELFTLDPHNTFKTPRETLINIFSGGTVRVLEIPLGAGAAAITLLCLITQLRIDDVIPSHDLEVEIVGGDFCDVQLAIARTMIEKLSPWWLEHSILVTLEAYQWDVFDDESTGDLIDTWQDKLGDKTALVIGANFSGLLGDTVEKGKSLRNIDNAEACLRSIFRVISKHKATTFWVEPSWKLSTKHFLPKLKNQVLKRFRGMRLTTDDLPISTSTIEDSVNSDGKYIVRSTGLHLKPNHQTRA